AQQVEWALDGRDHAGGHARVARCRIELVVTEESLNDADIGPTFEQMGRKTVARRMQRHRLLDAGRVSRLVKQTIELPGRHRLSWLAAREQPALLLRHARIVTSRSHLPPLPQQIERLWRQHDVAVFAPLGLHDADDVLRAVDIANPEPDHLARAQTCAVAESEQYVNLEIPRHGQQALGLVRAHHQRDLLGFFDVIDLGGKIQSPQRHAEQEPEPGHDAVAIADARPRLSQVQLEQADLVGCSRAGRTLQKRGEPLAAADVASLRVRVELARAHVLDHALAQGADGIGTHGELSCGGLTTPRPSETGQWPAIIVLAITHRARRKAARLSGLSRQRFSALAQMRPQLMSAVPPLLEYKRTYRCIVALCNWCLRDGIAWLAPLSFSS